MQVRKHTFDSMSPPSTCCRGVGLTLGSTNSPSVTNKYRKGSFTNYVTQVWAFFWTPPCHAHMQTSTNNSVVNRYSSKTCWLEVLTWVSLCVSMCENLGIRANSSRPRIRASCEHNLSLSLSIGIRGLNEPRVGTPIRRCSYARNACVTKWLNPP